MAFDSHESDRFAILPFLGGVNVISGESLLSADTKQSYGDETPKKQDYIIIPEQSRLDGICIRPGLVKQFVAMRTQESLHTGTPSSSKRRAEGDNIDAKDDVTNLPVEGQTIEWQMTGQDKIGGIQLQIIPQFKLEYMFAGSMKDISPGPNGRPLESYQLIPPSVIEYDVLKTPDELCLREGDTIHVKRLKKEKDYQYSRRKLVRDLLAEAPDAFKPSAIVEIEVIRSSFPEKILNIRIPGSDDCASFKVRSLNSFSSEQ